MTHSHLAPKTKRQKRTRQIVAGVVVLVVLTLCGFFGWRFLSERFAPAPDFPGPGSGSVIVEIPQGSTGEDIATILKEDGVIKSRQAFLEAANGSPDAMFQAGSFELKKQMNAQGALDALQDPANKAEARVVIPEGSTMTAVFQALSTATGLELTEIEKAAADPQALGVPAGFDTVEGYLFPATYTFDPGVSAEDALKRMVARMNEAVQAHGIPADKVHETLTFASVVQREAGANTDDFGKIARVFQNRLDQGIALQSDATVGYGNQSYGTVWTTREERADKSNPYNSYVHKGLPPGPIGAPGDLAIQSVMNPTPGDWLYFVTVNLSTGETKFATTLEEHNKNVAELGKWCTTHRDEGGKACD